MSKELRRLAAKVLGKLNHPVVRSLSRLSFKVLETADLLKSKNPILITAAGLSIADAVSESFNLPELSKLESFIMTLDVEPGYGNLPHLIYTSMLFNSLNKDTVFSSESESLIELDVYDGGKLYIVQYRHDDRLRDKETVGLDFFYTAGFDFDVLFQKIWTHYPHGIYLKRNKQTHTLELRSLPQINTDYIGSLNVSNFCKKMRNAVDSGISRSYLFHGPPGVGKTTAVLKIAYEYLGRVIKVDPGVARGLETGELEFFIQQLKPKMILFEDFDLAYSSADMALFMIENIKNTYPEITIFATVNDLEKLSPALLRPGRFDKLVFFGYPKDDEYSEIINMYFKQYNPTVPAEILASILPAVSGLSPAYLKELAIESRTIDAEDMHDELLVVIKEYHVRIEREKATFCDDDDDDDEMDSVDGERGSATQAELTTSLANKLRTDPKLAKFIAEQLIAEECELEGYRNKKTGVM